MATDVAGAIFSQSFHGTLSFIMQKRVTCAVPLLLCKGNFQFITSGHNISFNKDQFFAIKSFRLL